MVIRVQRWSPVTCNCIVEQQVDYADETKPIVSFLMMNTVCDKHQHLISKEFKPNHKELSDNVLDLIEQAKIRNLKQVDEQISKATRKKDKNQLYKARQNVIDHNNSLDEEWSELVSFIHAFDNHIHDQILIEQ